MGRPRSDIAPRIVRAARARFLAEGVDGASLRTIAKDAGTSVGMISYYFPTKDDLFLAVVEEVYVGLLADLETALAEPGSTREALLRAFVRIGGASDVELEVVRLVVREALVSSSRLDRILDRFSRGHVPMMLAALAKGVAAGEITDEVPLPMLLVASFAMGVLPQIALRAAGERTAMFAATRDLPKGDALAQQLVELLFRAIGRQSAPPARTKTTRRA